MNITDSKFESCDDVSQNERSRLCAEVGLMLEILALILYFVLTVFFVLLWEYRLPGKRSTGFEEIGDDY